MLVVCTHPGTEIKVTPEIEDPSIPKATMYHLDLRLPRKKPSEFTFLEVKTEIKIKIPKYESTIAKIISEFMFIFLQITFFILFLAKYFSKSYHICIVENKTHEFKIDNTNTGFHNYCILL